MSGIWKARLAVGMLVLAGAMGCNPILLTSYLFNGSDPKMPAEYALKPRPKHEKDEIKVVVLTSCGPGISPEMVGVDRLLASEIIPLLEARCVENKEKVTVLKSPPIDDFKKKHLDWRRWHPVDIGKHFEADYVIDIEVIDVGIYQPGTRRELLQGRAKVSVAAFDISKPLKEPSFSPPEFNFVYPKGYPVSAGDEPASTFRQKFVKRIAADLVIPFTAHTADQRVVVD